MKNQMMSVDLDGFILNIEHKTRLGNLTQLWAYGNKLRADKGKSELRLAHYLEKPETCEFLLEIERNAKSPLSGDLEIELSERGNTAKLIGGKLTCIKTKKGRYGGTWADLYVLLDAAATLDPAFKYKIYQTFINNKILDYRDQSGDGYKALCKAMHNGNLINKPYDYCVVAQAIALKILGSINKNEWNSASAAQLEQRTQLETRAMHSIEDGFITSLPQLLEFINRR